MTGIAAFVGNFEHGTRSRYVKGCRCAACRESNRLYYHQRQAQRFERLAELQQNDGLASSILGESDIAPAPQVWTTPSGEKRVRIYARACPGIDGPCSSNSHLRKDSKGGICGGCRVTLSNRGLVSAERARAHLARLAELGVGRRAVAAASDVALTSLLEIKLGRKLKIRTETERRILAVDAGARADSAHVSGARTWSAVGELLRMGWTKGAISQQALGNQAPALQLVGRKVLASTEHAVLQLLERSKSIRRRQAEAKAQRKQSLKSCPRCHRNHKDDPEALDWCLANLNAPIEAQEAAL